MMGLRTCSTVAIGAININSIIGRAITMNHRFGILVANLPRNISSHWMMAHYILRRS